MYQNFFHIIEDISFWNFVTIYMTEQDENLLSSI